MLLQLSEIQKQEALVEDLQQSRKNIQDTLIMSYSINQKSKTSLKDKFIAIFKQSGLLFNLIRQIEQSVQQKSLLPIILHQKDIKKLLHSSTTLPEWFEHVFSKEYEKEKINLETIASKMYKLHGLGEKNSQLFKAHWNFEILLKRYESLSEKELQNLDIIEEVENFEFLYKSCKEIFQKFLEAMAKKVVQFLQNTVESTMLYSKQLKKVKSFDDRGFRQIFTSYHQTGIHFPRSIHNQFSNADSKNTIKAGIKFVSTYQTGTMGDYYLDHQKNSKIQTIKNDSTVDSLRQRERANNQYFFRKSQQKNMLIDNSLTRETIKSAKSHNRDISRDYIHAPYQNYIRPHKNSRDQSIRSGRSYYDESIALKKHKSSTNLQQNPNTSFKRKYHQNSHHQNSQNTFRYQEIRASKLSIKNEPNSIPKKSVPHCPYHDKNLNHHCLKHCNKLSQHQKLFFNNSELYLTENNRQCYKSRNNNDYQKLDSVRSAGIQSPIYKKTSRSREEIDVSTSREKNMAEKSQYLRNSHEKHLDYYESTRSSLQKENVKFFGNMPLQNVNTNQTFLNKKTDRSIHKNIDHQLHYRNSRIQSPPVRAFQYYYN